MAVKSVDYWLGRVKRQFRKEGLTSWSIRPYLRVARHFLLHLKEQKREIQSVKPSNLQVYLHAQWRRFERRHGRLPVYDAKDWRSQYTGAIRRLLRLAQGHWPLPGPDDSLLEEFAGYLTARGLGAKVVRRYRLHAPFFLEYLRTRGLQVRCGSPEDVRAYFRVALRISQRNRPGLTRSIRSWRNATKWAVYSVLRFAQGEWPPPSAPPASCLRFRDYLEEAGYCKQAIRLRVRVTQQFLVHLNKRCTPLSAAGPAEIASA